MQNWRFNRYGSVLVSRNIVLTLIFLRRNVGHTNLETKIIEEIMTITNFANNIIYWII